VVGRIEAHRHGLLTVMSFDRRGTTAVRADTEPPVVRFSSRGPIHHGEAFRSNYVARGGRRVAIDGEPFMDREAAGDELTPGSLADDLSSVRVVRAEDVEGVLLPGFDGDRRARRWPMTVVLSAPRRAKQSDGGATRGRRRNGRRVSSARPRANR
jgi:hypothetical protein